jgi:3-dehydroquinate dehydratase
LGRISRIMAPLLGSCFSYVSLEKGTESAPGQLAVEDIREVFRILNIGGTEKA